MLGKHKISLFADGQCGIVSTVKGNIVQSSKDQQNLVVRAILGQLAQKIVRSLNNVLQPAIELSRTIVDEEDQQKAKKGYERLARTLKHIEDIVRPLSVLSFEEEDNGKSVCLGSEVKNLAQVLREIVREDINLSFSDNSKEKAISTSSYGVKLLLTALVLQAQQSLPLGGEIVIKTEDFEMKDQLAYHLGDLAPGAYGQLTVTARSAGELAETEEDGVIAPQDLQTFASSFGGALKFLSTEENVTSVSAYFPREDLDILGESKTGQTVLVCDDNECVVELTQHFLEDGGYKVLPATAPDKALDLIDENRGKVDLCILDIIMPSMSGPALFKCLRTIQPDLRVLFSSGYDNVPAISRKIPEGAFFLSKPMKEEELLDKVKKALEAPVPGE